MKHHSYSYCCYVGLLLLCAFNAISHAFTLNPRPCYSSSTLLNKNCPPSPTKATIRRPQKYESGSSSGSGAGKRFVMSVQQTKKQDIERSTGKTNNIKHTIKRVIKRLLSPATKYSTMKNAAAVVTIPAAVGAVGSAAFGSSNLTAMRKMVFAFTTLMVTTVIFKNRQQILFPGGSADPSFTEELPPGKLEGCPFLGPISVLTNSNQGLSKKRFKASSNNIWKMFLFGKPTAVVSGSKSVRELLEKEFNGSGTIQQVDQIGNSELFLGTNSLVSTHDKDQYNFLRRLIGQSMTPVALKNAMPAFQAGAEASVSQMLLDGATGTSTKPIVMKQVCRDLTLDVAWRQIIGLKLNTNEEITQFRKDVVSYLNGITSFLTLFLPKFLLAQTKAVKAKNVITSLINEKIDELEKNGKPDGSTLSAMIFARDEEDSGAKLSREEIVDNIFVLLLAGSDTSSLTLTNAMYLLGKNRNVWDKLVAEQEKVVSEYGTKITKDILDKECPYLDSVIREVMRLLPVSFGGVRDVKQTITLDNDDKKYQIPKNWMTIYGISLTHEQDPKTKLDDNSHMDVNKGFQPDRWLDEETRPTEYMPFGAGNRFCLGHGLAMIEMKTFLAVVARNIDFDLVNNNDSKTKWKEGTIITPADGVKINVRPRQLSQSLSSP